MLTWTLQILDRLLNLFEKFNVSFFLWLQKPWFSWTLWIIRPVSSCQRDPTKKKKKHQKGFSNKKTNTHSRPHLPMSLKVQFRHVQASIPRTYKKKRKRSVRKVSQIQKLLPALTNDRPISSYPSQHSEILQKKEKEILGSSQIKKKINTKS